VPLYEYACLKCGRHTDKIEPVSGPHLKKCPHCGGKVESVITAPAIKFKGSGWYINDYAAKTSSGEADGSSSDTKDSKDSKDSKESKDSSSKDTSSKDSSKDSKSASSKDRGSKESGVKESSSTKEKKSSAKKD
jgi:putative FmdB family regulatory protein